MTKLRLLLYHGSRAESRSLDGLLRILSSLNRFKAEIGGQLRITTVSSLRSSKFENGSTRMSRELDKTHDSLRHAQGTFYSARYANTIKSQIQIQFVNLTSSPCLSICESPILTPLR